MFPIKHTFFKRYIKPLILHKYYIVPIKHIFLKDIKNHLILHNTMNKIYIQNNYYSDVNLFISLNHVSLFSVFLHDYKNYYFKPNHMSHSVHMKVW